VVRFARDCAISCGKLRFEGMRRLSRVVQPLALQTICSPRHGSETLGRDRLFALEAYPKLAVIYDASHFFFPLLSG
jgi:hypothetical protein